MEQQGVNVQKPNGGLQFGGRLNYEKSPHLTWRAEVYYWQDQGSGNFQGVGGTLNFTNKIRLVPIMLGAQYNFGNPGAKVRMYAGAGGGVMLVKPQLRIVANFTDPQEEPVDELLESSGSDFIGKPFVGLELGTSHNFAFFTELGYAFGKYTSEEVDPESGAKTSEDTSINGLHLTGGIKIGF